MANRILDKLVGQPYHCFIIAEAGSNHNGDIRLAKRLIEAAKECGCDAVKFQAFKTEELVTRLADKAEYQKQRSSGKSQFEMLKALELSGPQLVALKDHAQRAGIPLFFSVFDRQSADEVYNMGIDIFKLGSGELTNIPLIRHIARKARPLILSTGMAEDAEIAEAINAFKEEGNAQLLLMHCSTGYPVELKDANLKRIEYLERKFAILCGYSDHSHGIIASILAAAMGCPFIEKHFTLDKNLPGPDHPMSLDPQEMQGLCAGIRIVEKKGYAENGLVKRAKSAGITITSDEVELILGNEERRLSEKELSQRPWARKSIVAARDIAAGELLSEGNLAIKRPAEGLPPKDYRTVLGRKAKIALPEGTPLKREMLE